MGTQLRWLGLGRAGRRPVHQVRQLLTAGILIRWAGLGVAVAIIQGSGAIIGHKPFGWTAVLVWSLIMIVVGATVAAVDLLTPGLASSAPTPSGPAAGAGATSPTGSAVRLSVREQQVLKLIA